MKEATGELNMTVITIIMIGAILAFFWIMWGNIKGKINDQWDNATDDNDYGSYHYEEKENVVALENNGINYTMTW